MHLNTTPLETPRKPCWRDYSQLVSPTGLLPTTVVPLLSLKQLKRRIGEINCTHPQYREEASLVLAYEQKRCRLLRGCLEVTVVNQSQVA